MKDSPLSFSSWITILSGFMLSSIAAASLAAAEPQISDPPAATDGPRFPVLSNAEAWQRLPAAVQGKNQPLPTWARMLAAELPRTTAAFLELDLAQRTKNPVPPQLRAGMRLVAAKANQCAYSYATAGMDAIEAKIGSERALGLRSGHYEGWSKDEQAALAFAHKMSVDSDSVTDEEFAHLVKAFGEKQVASMVLMMAYANFQDRFLLSIGAPENGGPASPVQVAFGPEAFVFKTTAPPALKKESLAAPTGQDQIPDDPDWAAVSYDTLQQRLESQRTKPTRLPVLPWDKIAPNLPEGLIPRPSDIVWYRIVFAYAPELAVPFEVFMRTAGAETSPKWDRIFGQSLFWVTTRAVKCPYCMGHCEMNWEVAGLTPLEIADRSRLLSGNDWSSFTPAEQHAFAFARKLTATPWSVSRQDADELKQDFGPDRALIVMLNASRYHYMTRISNGFQLTLERDNVFYDYYNVKSPEAVAASQEGLSCVPLLSVEECWQRMPATVSGGGQTLPNWVRGVAGHLPRTAAAMLQLDHAHRTRSPIDPVLRAKMRWVIAHANRCAYSEAYALMDLKRTGVDAAAVKTFATGDGKSWAEEDREPLEFARLLTVAAPTIPDELVERLKNRFGEKRFAAMVLLAAYGNFQDRVILGLKLPIEVGGPLPPLDVRFADDAFQVAPIFPPQTTAGGLGARGQKVVAEDKAWSAISYDQLQARLEKQRDRQPRLRVPTWDEVKLNLPPAMAARPTRIVWNLVCSGYVPELAIPWSISTRTMWSETKPDRVLEESLFWIQTRAIECNYCMGHCEMLLEVAGLDQQAIAERTKALASSDWSAFPPAEQRAFAYARKLSKTPWDLTADDYRALEADYGPDKAMATFWWLCRGLYMTRVSDGFQLPLERENVFAPPPVKTSEASQ